MKTAHEFEAMPLDEALELFNDLAFQYYGHDRWKTQMADEIGMTRAGVNNWFRDGQRPSPLAFLWLQMSVETSAYRDTFRNLAACMETAKIL